LREIRYLPSSTEPARLAYASHRAPTFDAATAADVPLTGGDVVGVLGRAGFVVRLGAVPFPVVLRGGGGLTPAPVLARAARARTRAPAGGLSVFLPPGFRPAVFRAGFFRPALPRGGAGESVVDGGADPAAGPGESAGGTTVGTIAADDGGVGASPAGTSFDPSRPQNFSSPS
jgi:hypothetical protein